MQHYFVKEIVNQNIYFEEEDIHHILHVMRFKNNDEIIANFNGVSYKASLVIQDKFVYAVIKEKLDKKDNTLDVTIIHGMPKNDKFELALQKATELGVKTYVPYLSDRSVVKIEPKDFAKKVERWSKIVKEASEQSERLTLPIISSPIDAIKVKEFMSDVNLICDENLGRNLNYTLRKALVENKGKSITLVIGPEGGFSSKEFDYFHALGFISVGLGKRILRSETAVMYALSAISFLNEEE